MSRVIRIAAVVGIVLLGAGSVSADVTLSFTRITNNSMPMSANQLFVDVCRRGN